jgi:hypothetical protein
MVQVGQNYQMFYFRKEFVRAKVAHYTIQHTLEKKNLTITL